MRFPCFAHAPLSALVERLIAPDHSHSRRSPESRRQFLKGRGGARREEKGGEGVKGKGREPKEEERSRGKGTEGKGREEGRTSIL